MAECQAAGLTQAFSRIGASISPSAVECAGKCFKSIYFLEAAAASPA